jgi:protocatechuate 3,4-dioxygenase alpha subunit
MVQPTTPSQTVGPYYAIGLSRRAENELVPPSDLGALRLAGRLLDGEGDPIDGMIEVWDAVARRWGRSGTDAEGRFSFVVPKPASGRDGDAPRLDVHVFARGLLRHQLTRIYFPDEAEANAGDPVLSSVPEEARATLIAEAEDGALRFDIRMQGEPATVFFALPPRT